MKLDNKEMSIATRNYREMLLADPYRPTWHFAVPDDWGKPGDVNGAFYADGRYHLMYLYRNSESGRFQWGHISSHDLLHWRHHPDALKGAPNQKGCFSGGCFVDEDGTAYISYWKLEGVSSQGRIPGGIAIACARPPYEKWEEMEQFAVTETEWGITDLVVDGKTIPVGCADPTNIWKADGFYYMQLGNKVVLDKYGMNEDSPEMFQGDWTELFRSKDLRNWEFVHRFYENTHEGADWPDRTEDNMCPSFLPLYDAKSGGKPSGKWLELFISHNKGCQYYVGSLKGETFYPEIHGRMTWKDKAFFAPEALIDGKGRQLVWAWLVDILPNDIERFGWSGVYSFPRNVWWENGTLRMAPAEELEKLQYNHQSFDTIPAGAVPVKNGESFRLKAVWDPAKGKTFGFSVRVSTDGRECAPVYVDTDAGSLVLDASICGAPGWQVKEEAPFVLEAGEKLCLDILVDRSVIEVYANERQAICRRVYPTDPKNSLGVRLIGNPEALEELDVWEIDPCFMY